MLNTIFLYTGSALIFLWGILHLLPTKSIVREFENTAKENLRIVLMGWIMEALTLIFIGILTFSLTFFVGAMSLGAIYTYRLSALMLIAMGIVTELTGARTEAIPIKFCPIVKGICAILFILGSFL